MSKTAIIVFSDPKAGEEALGRVFNAMFITLELKDKDQDVALIFQGAGTRWPAELAKPDHQGHPLYNAVRDKVAGVCGGCADVFGASESLRGGNLQLIRDKAIPGTSGILDLSRYLDDGYRLITL
jgi:hypothetical protein